MCEMNIYLFIFNISREYSSSKKLLISDLELSTHITKDMHIWKCKSPDSKKHKQ